MTISIALTFEDAALKRAQVQRELHDASLALAEAEVRHLRAFIAYENLSPLGF